MLKGILTRKWKSDRCTLGTFELFADGSRNRLFHCYVCEDPVRGDGDPATVAEWKIKGESAIPYGTYRVRKTYSKRFDKDVWELQNVPGFSGIRIHAGNTAKDTEGCLLFGEYSEFLVVNSRATIDKFEKVLSDLGNPEWEIEIK